jgi:hypothetical protein
MHALLTVCFPLVFLALAALFLARSVITRWRSSLWIPVLMVVASIVSLESDSPAEMAWSEHVIAKQALSAGLDPLRDAQAQWVVSSTTACMKSDAKTSHAKVGWFADVAAHRAHLLALEQRCVQALVDGNALIDPARAKSIARLARDSGLATTPAVLALADS